MESYLVFAVAVSGNVAPLSVESATLVIPSIPRLFTRLNTRIWTLYALLAPPGLTSAPLSGFTIETIGALVFGLPPPVPAVIVNVLPWIAVTVTV